MPRIYQLHLWVKGRANQLCFGRLAYRGYLFGLDERLTEKAKRGFVFHMYGYAELGIIVMPSL